MTGFLLFHCVMPGRVIFITGTDTGVGKTVLTALLVAHLRNAGKSVAAIKPVCSGGRDDARLLHGAPGGALSLEEVNPWHFRAALAPSLAAQREGKSIRLDQVTAHVKSIRRRFELVLVEGAGGLLSPLGLDFDSRELIVSLRAIPVVVCPNRLGTVNQALLVLAALPRVLRARAPVVLVSTCRNDPAMRTNPDLLRGCLGNSRVHVLPGLANPGDVRGSLRRSPVRRAIEGLVEALDV